MILFIKASGYIIIDERKVVTKATVPVGNFIFIIRFYAIMHRTTIVQNKISNSICSCLFFCPDNIYRLSLGKVRLGRPNPKLFESLNFYLTRKKNTFYSELYALQHLAPIFNFHFRLFLKNIFKNVSKNL